MKKLAFTTIIFLSLLSLGQSQTMQAWIEEGEKAFEEGDYYGAYKCYEIALRYKAARLEKYDSIRASMLYNYAEAARLAQVYGRADSIYQEVLKSPSAKHFPLTNYWLGVVKHTRGKYEQSRDFYQTFLNQADQVNEDYTEAANRGFENALWALSVKAERDDVQVEHLNTNVNSKHSDYAAAFKGDTMYYSSYRHLDKKDSLNPPRYYMRIMETTILPTGELAEKGVELPAYVNRPGRHVAHTAFTQQYDQVYYTICDYLRRDTIQCKLHRADIQADGSWVNAIELNVNAKGATNTHPSIGYDYEEKKEVLYFASDRKGGEGKLDIWFSYIDPETGNLTLPKNLKGINTADDDATPYFHTETQTLYFSTTGYQTLGGFDNYQTRKRDGRWTTPEHLGIPINSSYNDMYYTQVVEDGKKVAYFSSNRPDSSAVFWDSSKEYCCNDIYKLKLPMIDLLARTFNLKDSLALVGATVELYEIGLDGEEILIDKLVNTDNNQFPFSIERGKKYRLKGTKNGFSEALAEIDTDDPRFTGKSTIEQDLYLDPSMDLIVNTWHALDTTPLTEVRVQLYEITPGGPHLVSSGITLQTNNVTFPVERGRKYMVTGLKPGFIGVDTTYIDLTDPVYSQAKTATADLYLGQTLEVATFEAGTIAPLVGVRLELLELVDGEPKLIHDNINMLDNTFKFELDLNRPYMLRASKDGFQTVEEILYFTPEDAIAWKGEPILDVYLPRPAELVLYFDNDHPNPRTRLRRTRLEYIETNEVYYEQKDRFIAGFTEGMTKNDSFIVSRRFRDFFDRDVNRAPERLIEFSNRLIALLANGQDVTVQLMGSASPKGKSGYNSDLAARRIDCVKNHFKRYKDPDGKMLKPYIDSGKLKFIENNFGESNYDPVKVSKIEGKEQVSDDDDDLKASVYDLVASARRHVRVRLVGAESFQTPPQRQETRPNTRDEK